MRMLLAYQNPVARQEIVDRHPELGAAIDLIAALLRAQDAELFDAPSRARAAAICLAARRYVGYVQETQRANLTIGQELALARLKQAFRDAALVLPWPYNRDGDLVRVSVDQRGLDALARLRGYDFMAGPATYAGSMADDLATLVAGTTLGRLT